MQFSHVKNTEVFLFTGTEDDAMAVCSWLRDNSNEEAGTWNVCEDVDASDVEEPIRSYIVHIYNQPTLSTLMKMTWM